MAPWSQRPASGGPESRAVTTAEVWGQHLGLLTPALLSLPTRPLPPDAEAGPSRWTMGGRSVKLPNPSVSTQKQESSALAGLSAPRRPRVSQGRQTSPRSRLKLGKWEILVV